MTNTTLGAGAEKAQEIIFISEAHAKFYYENEDCRKLLISSMIKIKVLS